MIKYLTHSEIDKSLWDRRLVSSTQGEVYAFSWFLDIVSPGWDALVKDNYESVFPLTKRKKFGIDYLYQPYFTQQLGLFSSEEVSKEEMREFLEAIPDKFRFIEIQVNAGNPDAETGGFEFHRRRSHILDLSPDLEKLRSGYSENLKRNLKKTVSAGIEPAEGNVISEIVSLFRNTRGKSIENLKEADYIMFERLMESANERNLLETIYVKDENNMLLAGAVFLKSVHSWIFIFSATSDVGRQNGAMSRIIDSFIQRHSGEKMSLDFEGSMDENLSRFYKSFGSQEVVYLQVRKNKLPSLIRWLK